MKIVSERDRENQREERRGEEREGEGRRERETEGERGEGERRREMKERKRAILLSLGGGRRCSYRGCECALAPTLRDGLSTLMA